MRHKRLKNCAHTICDVFCGWEKYPDDGLFRARDEGRIQADLVECKATLDGEPYEFAALRSAQNWLYRDLEANNIPKDSIDQAFIELRFTKGDWSYTGKQGYSLCFRGYRTIISGEDCYKVPYEKIENWVPGP